MIIFNVAPGSRDNYKIWEEGEVPKVVFEITSAGTKDQDEGFKQDLYEQLGVEEYWQFDPKEDWIPGQLRGYRLVREAYLPIANNDSQALGLRLEPNGALISFYRLDNGEKLLIPAELRERAEKLQDMLTITQSALATMQSELNTTKPELDRYRQQFGSLD
jgi:Putative restriction endonuclease